jgi:hypothetical protein
VRGNPQVKPLSKLFSQSHARQPIHERLCLLKGITQDSVEFLVNSLAPKAQHSIDYCFNSPHDLVAGGELLTRCCSIEAVKYSRCPTGIQTKPPEKEFLKRFSWWRWGRVKPTLPLKSGVFGCSWVFSRLLTPRLRYSFMLPLSARFRWRCYIVAPSFCCVIRLCYNTSHRVLTIYVIV